MHFAFKWKHRDGSSIRFSPEGWHSDDPAKAGWLNQESELFELVACDSWGNSGLVATKLRANRIQSERFSEASKAGIDPLPSDPGLGNKRDPAGHLSENRYRV
jgi:hypothetical protein